MPDSCPVCASSSTYPVAFLPDVPVFCNILLDTPEEARAVARGNLALTFCATCGHTFNAAFEPEKVAYTPQYENSLHFSPRFQAYAEALATELVERYGLYGKTIVEIGAGQGDFLAMLCEKGENRGVGYDPGFHGDRDLPPGVRIIPEYYGRERMPEDADLVVCRHVLEHIPDPVAFLQDMRQHIQARGTPVYFEVPNMAFTYREDAIWDLIYEHCSYFSPSSLMRAFQEAGFHVIRVQETFGGQYLHLEALPTAEPSVPRATASPELMAQAREFGERVEIRCREWQERLRHVEAEEKKAVIWGAGSKGVSFVNLLGDSGALQALVDINPRKQGRYVSGSGLPILGPEQLPALRPDIVLVMNPNYLDEIRRQVERLGLQPDYWLAMGSETTVSTEPGQKMSR